MQGKRLIHCPIVPAHGAFKASHVPGRELGSPIQPGTSGPQPDHP